jgi:hypothetical protein
MAAKEGISTTVKGTTGKILAMDKNEVHLERIHAANGICTENVCGEPTTMSCTPTSAACIQ